MYTIVLVIKKNTHIEGYDYNNIERFINIALKSYKKYLNLDDVAEFIVITPQNELEYISSKIISEHPVNKWKWNFISEDKLVDTRIPAGWGKQQTSKLAISALIKTKEYLIIDDDTFLVKPFSYKDMFIDDKLIFNKAKIDFPFFYLWSSQLLEMDFDKVQYQPFHMGITPQVFVTDIVKDIVRFLIIKYGNDKKWQIMIVNNKFTEYTLYWIWLIKNDLITKYNTETDIAMYGNAVTEYSEDLPKIVATNFTHNNKNYYFSFIQSSLKYKNDELIKLFNNV